MGQQKLEEALGHFERALSLKAEFPQAQAARQQLLVSLERTAELVDELEEKQRELPQDHASRMHLARAYRLDDRFTDAVRLLREALHCPVDIFDPFAAVDLSALTPTEHEDLERHRSESVVALGLAATVLDDSLYSLEILPEAVKRRQRFVQRTIYNIAAALVLVALLAVLAVRGDEQVAAADRARRSAERRRARFEKDDRQATKVIAANEIKRRLIDELVTRSVPFDSSLRVMRILQQMPQDLWIKSVEVTERTVKGGRDRKKGVQVKGHGKEVSGRSIQRIFTRWAGELAKTYHPEITSDPRGDTIDFGLFFDFVQREDN